MRTEAGAGLARGLPGPFRKAQTRVLPHVRTSQTAVTLVVAELWERVRIELELKMIFNFIFGRHKKQPKRQASALADLHVGEKAILADLELSQIGRASCRERV